MCLRESDNEYDYISTRVNDFKIAAQNPQRWMGLIEKKFLVKISLSPDFYLENHFHYIYIEKKKGGLMIVTPIIGKRSLESNGRLDLLAQRKPLILLLIVIQN